jgi:hypothetical protein
MIVNNTSGSNVNIEDLKGLLIIDFWEDPPQDNWIDRNKHKINFDQFDSIVVANYGLLLDGNDIIQHNLLVDYCWTNFVPEMLLPMLEFAKDKKTHPWLQSHLNAKSFLILTPESMQHHVESMVPHVTDWLVVGGSWKICTHQRQLGFYFLTRMPYNFYITDWTMLGDQVKPGSIEHIEKDDLIWVDYTNNLFQLKRNETT